MVYALRKLVGKVNILSIYELTVFPNSFHSWKPCNGLQVVYARVNLLELIRPTKCIFNLCQYDSIPSLEILHGINIKYLIYCTKTCIKARMNDIKKD